MNQWRQHKIAASMSSLPTPQHPHFVPLPQTNCHNPSCQALIQMPHPILQQPVAYLRKKATDSDDLLAVVCHSCRHGFAYSVGEFYVPSTLGTHDPFGTGELSLFCVSLECDNKDCKIRTELFASKPHGVSTKMAQDELQTWTIEAISCYCGAQLIIPPPSALARLPLGPENPSPGEY